MLKTAWRDARHEWCAANTAQRILYVAGGLLMLSGLVHAGIGLAVEDSWEGPVSWRKPALFGLATGVTLLSLGWVLGLLDWKRTGRILALVTAAAAIIEVALITLQTWRGVPSHFNVATPFDAFVNYAIDVLITVVTLAIATLTIGVFGRLRQGGRPAARDVALAARAGLVLLLLSCLFGYFMLVYGAQRVQSALPPEIFGSAGLLKFVHGIPMHAIQILPISCWILLRLGFGELHRTRLVQALTAGVAALSIFAAVQTFAGRSRFDFMPATTVLVAIAAVLFAVPLITVFRHWLTKPANTRNA
jgi:hypothetical protein